MSGKTFLSPLLTGFKTTSDLPSWLDIEEQTA